MRHGLSPLAAFLLVFGMAASLFADGMIIIEPPVERPEVRITPMAVKYHKVAIVIENQVATTTVDEVFHNPNNMQLEGTYVFPLPENAAISALSLWIDGKEQAGELLDKDKARGIYEDIVRKMRDPALLEYVGSRVFKLRIFPLPANGDRQVKLSYSEKLTCDNGLCTYRYPLNTEKFSSRNLEEVVISAEIRSDLPVKSVYSPSHPIDVAQKDDHNIKLSYEAKDVKPDKDFFLYFGVSDKEIGLSLVPFRRNGEDGYFMALLSPKAEVSESDIVKKDVVFIFDTSMSMMEQNKFEQAKKALNFCVGSLNSGDRYNIVSFSTEARPFRDKLMEVNDDSKKAGLEYISELKARGGTNINEALLMSLDMAPKEGSRPFMVVFITDGEPTIGDTTDPDQILKNVRGKDAKNVRIFSLGVGYEINAKLLDRLAEENRGTREYVTPDENLEVKVSNFYEKISSPVLSDLALSFEGLETYDVYPKRLGDLFKGSQLVVFGRYKGDGAKAIKLTGTVNGEKRELVYETTFPAEQKQNDSLPRLWATSKVAYLLDQIRLHGEAKEVKDEVIALSKQYGIMTPYTSWLVIEDLERRRADAPGAPAAPMEHALRKMGEGDDEKEEAQKAREGMNAAGGAGGVAASDSLGRMQQDAGKGYSFGDKDAEAKKSRAEQAGIMKTVGSKTFYFDSGVWADSIYQAGVETKKVKYMSDEYFDLLSSVQGIGKYLALGNRVIVVLDGTAYEVTE